MVFTVRGGPDPETIEVFDQDGNRVRGIERLSIDIGHNGRATIDITIRSFVQLDLLADGRRREVIYD